MEKAFRAGAYTYLDATQQAYHRRHMKTGVSDAFRYLHRWISSQGEQWMGGLTEIYYSIARS